MTTVTLVLLGLVTYLVMRRRGRVFLEKEEAVLVAVYLLLALVQRLAYGTVNLNDHFVTPLYFALPVVVGHSRGSERGATAAILGGAAMCVMSLAFLEGDAGAGWKGFPGQYVVVMALLGVTGAGAGLRLLPKALKPLLTGTWIAIVAAYHPEYLHSIAAYVIQFTAVAVASLGLYLNPLGTSPVRTITYPVAPSRRT